jgi:hypothetical protein
VDSRYYPKIDTSFSLGLPAAVAGGYSGVCRYLAGDEDVLVKAQGHYQSGVGVQRRALAAALDLADLTLPDPRVHSQLLLRPAQRTASLDQQVDQAVLDL